MQKESEISNDTAVKVHSVSKKYCKSLKRSMYYGIIDILRNVLCLQSKSGLLRTQEFWAVENVSFEYLRKERRLVLLGRMVPEKQPS